MSKEGAESEVDAVARLCGGHPLEEVSLGHVQSPKCAHDCVGHQPGLVSQHRDSQQRLQSCHNGIVADGSQMTALGDAPALGDKPVDHGNQTGRRDRPDGQTGPEGWADSGQKPGRDREEVGGRSREAASQIVHHLPAAAGSDADLRFVARRVSGLT